MRPLLGLILVSRAAMAQGVLAGSCLTSATTAGTNAVSTATMNSTGATLLVLSAGTYSDSACLGSINDSLGGAGTGNNWHCIADYASGVTNTALWYAYDSGSGAALKVGPNHSFSLSQSGAYPGFTVRAFSGTVTGADPLRAHNGAAGSSTGSITPSGHDLVVANIGLLGGSGWSVGSPLTTDCSTNYGAGGNAGSEIGYQLNAAGIALNAAWSGGSGTPASSIAAFKTVSATCTITTSSLPGGVVGAAYSQSIATANSCPSPSWSISAGSLPAGLTMNASTGTISGTPTGAAGASNFTVLVTTGNGNSSAPLSINVQAAAPAISAVSLAGNSPSSLVMSWTTDTASSSQIECGTSSGSYTVQTSTVCTGAGGSGVCISHAGDGITTHKMIIGGLAANTTYYCKALSAQPLGVPGLSAEFQASTLPDVVSTPFAVSVSEATNYNSQYDGSNGMPANGRSVHGDTIYWYWGANGLFATLGDTAGVTTSGGSYSGADSHITWASQPFGPMTGPLTVVNNFIDGQVGTCGSDLECWGHNSNGESNTGGWTDGATWSPERGISFKGCHIMPVMRINGGINYGYGSWIESCDDGVTWTSPQDGTNQPASGHAMWPAGYHTRCGSQLLIQHAQDYGGVNGEFPFTNYADADAYVYGLCNDGYLFRVRIEDALLLDATKISYWTGGTTPATTTWGTLNQAVSVLPPQCALLPSMEFIPDFNRYMLTCQNWNPLIFDGPYPWGPWTWVGVAPRSTTWMQYEANFPQPLAHTYRKLTSSPLTATIQLLAGGDQQGQLVASPAANTYGPLWYNLMLTPRSLAPGAVSANPHITAGLDLFYDFNMRAISDWLSGSLPDRSPGAAYTAPTPGLPRYDKHGMYDWGYFLAGANACYPACGAPQTVTVTTPYTKASTAFTLAIVFSHTPDSISPVNNEAPLDKSDIQLTRNGTAANSWKVRIGTTTVGPFALNTDVAQGGKTWPTLFIRWDGTNISVISSAGAVVPINTLATGVFTGTLGTTALTLGSLAGGSQPFYGTMSELLVWSRALSDSEIAREAAVIRREMAQRGLIIP